MRPIRLVLLAPLLVGLLFLSGLSMAWSVTGIDGSAVTDPHLMHPSHELHLIMARLSEVGDGGPSEILPQAIKALRKAPLEEEPFIIAAYAGYNAGRYAEARALVDVARRRSARSKAARFLAVDVNIALGEIDAAVRDLEALQRLARDQSTLVFEILVLLTGHPETRKAALGALQDDTTKAAVLAGLATSGADPDMVLDAVKITEAAAAINGDPAKIAAITRPLAEAGNVEGAYRVWTELAGHKPMRKELIRGSAFEDDLAPPFGWDLRSGRDAYVVRQKAGGLAGEAYGRRSALLARQLLMLQEGSYRLEADAPGASNLIEAVVQCVGAKQIAAVRINRPGITSAGFAVPEDCPAQWLDIKARASDPPRPDAFRIESITISRAGP